MPSSEVHCKKSLERTGKDFKELHEWMDKPGEVLGIDHRRVRHDLSYIDEVKAGFGVEGVREFLKHIAEDYWDTAERWGRKCATPGCENNTWHKNNYCNTCIRARKKAKK